MRLCTGLSRAEFALLARPRATSRATDSLYLFESRPLSLHGLLMMRQSEEEKWSILYSETRIVVENPDYTHRPVLLCLARALASPTTCHFGLSLYLRPASNAYDLWRYCRSPSWGIVAGSPLIPDFPVTPVNLGFSLLFVL